MDALLFLWGPHAQARRCGAPPAMARSYNWDMLCGLGALVSRGSLEGLFFESDLFFGMCEQTFINFLWRSGRALIVDFHQLGDVVSRRWVGGGRGRASPDDFFQICFCFARSQTALAAKTLPRWKVPLQVPA